MADIYELLWKPQEYLSQYYTSGYVEDDEIAIFKSMIAWLKQSGRRYERCIDFGCGCTLHHVMPLIPYVSEIHLADYLPDNLTEVQKWLDEQPGAHNWDVYFQEVLRLEGKQNISINDLTLRKQELRRKITALKPGNIHNPHPLLDNSTYDLVTSFYCLEAVTSSKVEWQTLISNLCRLLTPDGTLILSALRECQFYTVMENKFPVTTINETDLMSVLAENGFKPTCIEIKVVQIKEWVEQGFDSICIVKAERLI